MPQILLVEDDAGIAEVLRDLLRMEGYSVTEAYHGGKALDLIDRGYFPDLIILDLMMPVMDGREFLQHLTRRPEPLASIPTIVVTAKLPRPRPEDLAPNVIRVFPKPIDIVDFLDSLSGVTGGDDSVHGN